MRKIILDQIFNDILKEIGKNILQEKLSKNQPENINDLFQIFNTIKLGIENKEKRFGLLGYIFYNFISSNEARKRKVTARNVEDLLSFFLGGDVQDEVSKSNPTVPKEIEELDSLCKNEDWKISEDLAGNKREKDDIKICNYTISIKTLVGETYGSNGQYINKKGLNKELNIGSVSYRALFKGIINDEVLHKLSDRKGGLGSKVQLKNLFDEISCENKEFFISRLMLYFNFLYNDDFLILLKENYRIRIILFSGEDFRNGLKKAWDKGLDHFLTIFYRWENNNLRIMWQPLLSYLDNYLEVELPLYNVFNNFELDSFFNTIKEKTFNEIKNNLF